MNALRTILARLREPSTMAAIGVLIALFGGPAGLPTAVAQVLGGLAALAGVLMPEQGTIGIGAVAVDVELPGPAQPGVLGKLGSLFGKG